MGRSLRETSDQTSTNSGLALSLHSLSPEYVEEDHGRYVALLTTALGVADSGSRNGTNHGIGPRPRNIALTGHYGSGKSSVLVEVQRQCGARAINVSLSSLGADEGEVGRIGASGEAPPLTNLIQKEIVKQLLYRKSPSSMKGSRYHRIDSFQAQPAGWWSAAAAVMVFLFSVLVNAVGRIESVFPWDLAKHHPWVAWATLGAIAAGVGILAFGIQHDFHNRISITNISAGPAAVSLSKRENSYFDEYLDEIVYFFQRSSVNVVIFEDLDRFKDPHIFETLRELNTVLNNADQTGAKPIQFVYAIRDSVFEQLDDHDGELTMGTGRARWLVPASSNRTKFFDLVVPMVPFISHRTSRDLLRRMFDDVAKGPSSAALDLVASYLTDMRLIKNIRNEYDVYASSILPPSGLDGLEPDQLFAMTVYKNLHMADYERIREGTSAIDAVFGASRRLVADLALDAERRATAARAGIARADNGVARAAEFGARLKKVAPILLPGWTAGHGVFCVGQANFDATKSETQEFWRAVADEEGLTLFQGQQRSVSSADLEVLLDIKINPDAWTDEARAKYEKDVEEATALRDFVARADVATLLDRPDLYVKATPGVEPVTLAEVAEGQLPSALAHALVREGLIDENYVLYVARFTGLAVSASAMNFIIHTVQRDQPDYRYHFAETHDIDQVLAEDRERFINGPAVFNIEVFDHLLDHHDSSALNSAITRLANDNDSQADFVDAYLASGRRPLSLLRRLSPHWTGIFDYLAGRDEPTSATSLELLDAALGAAATTTRYAMSPTTRALIETVHPELETFRSPIEIGRARAIAALLVRNGVSIAVLGKVADPLKTEIVQRNLYPITTENLTVASGSADVALDQLKATDDEVYRYAVEQLPAYLEALPRDRFTVSDPGAFASVLNDLARRKDADALARQVCDRAAAECITDDIATVEDLLWPALAATGRMTTAFANIEAYIDARGIDDDLRILLDRAENIEDPQEDDDARHAVAVRLINETGLSEQARIRLVNLLDLTTYIKPTQVEDKALSLVPRLVANNEIRDLAAVWDRVSDAAWEIKEALINASTTFADYFPEVSLSDDDIAGILRSASLPDSTKALLFDRLDEFIEELSPQTAEALAHLAARTTRVMTVEEMESLAQAGASAAAIVASLAPSMNSLDRASAIRVLSALGGPYDRLVQTGAKPIDLPASAAPLVERLRTLGFVTSSKPNRKSGGLRVYTKRG